MPAHARLSIAWLTAQVLLCPPARADQVWLCGLSADLVQLQCVADPDDDVEPAAPTASVHGTRFPLDPGRRWTVDLWSPPNDPAEVELLARATICYRSPGCSVVLTMPRTTFAARRR